MVRDGRGLVAVAAVAVSVVVAGCGDRGDRVEASAPSVSSSAESPSLSVTQSPSVAGEGPSVPQAARQRTPAGAEAFVRFYFTQLNVALMTANPEAIRSLSASGCRFCSQNMENAVEMATKGEHYASEPVALSDLRPAPGAPPGQMFISVRIVQSGAAVVSDAGAEIRRDDTASGESLVGVGWTATGWRLLDVEVA